MPPPLRLPNACEQQVLQHLVVRPITQAERPRWSAEVAAPHYLKNATLVGEHLCYVAESQGRWLVLRGWSASAGHQLPNLVSRALALCTARLSGTKRAGASRLNLATQVQAQPDGGVLS